MMRLLCKIFAVMNLFVIFACEKGFVSFHLLQRISRLFYDTMKKLNFHIHGSC